MNNQTYQLSFYVFSICWTSFGYLTSMPLIVFRLLWMLRCWASADYCKSNSRFPYAPSVRVTHGNRTKPFQQPETGAALSRPYLKTIHFTLHLAEASWDKPRYTEMQSCDNHLTFFIVRKYSLILKCCFSTKTFHLFPNMIWSSRSISLSFTWLQSHHQVLSINFLHTHNVIAVINTTVLSFRRYLIIPQ